LAHCSLYGLFALTFNDRGGATYVTLAGHRYDADVVGVLSLVIALTMIAAGVLIGSAHVCPVRVVSSDAMFRGVLGRCT
jgi:hypothetical protein